MLINLVLTQYPKKNVKPILCYSYKIKKINNDSFFKKSLSPKKAESEVFIIFC